MSNDPVDVFDETARKYAGVLGIPLADDWDKRVAEMRAVCDAQVDGPESNCVQHPGWEFENRVDVTEDGYRITTGYRPATPFLGLRKDTTEQRGSSMVQASWESKLGFTVRTEATKQEAVEALRLLQEKERSAEDRKRAGRPLGDLIRESIAISVLAIQLPGLRFDSKAMQQLKDGAEHNMYNDARFRAIVEMAAQQIARDLRACGFETGD